MKNINNVIKIATGQDDDCTAGCLLHFVYFKHYYKLIAIDLNKQQALDADPDCTAGCLLHFVYFKYYYKLIAIDLNKQQALDADSEAIKDISFKYITFT